MSENELNGVLLEKARLCLLSYVPEDYFDDLQISTHATWTGEVVIRALKTALVHKINNSRIQHPENWKEALKERWLPEWVKKKFPVRYKKYDAYMIFPDLFKKYKPKDGELYLHYDSPGGILKEKNNVKCAYCGKPMSEEDGYYIQEAGKRKIERVCGDCISFVSIENKKAERKFLIKHRHAAELIYDENTKELICAVYLNPEYTLKKERRQFLTNLRRIIDKGD